MRTQRTKCISSYDRIAEAWDGDLEARLSRLPAIMNALLFLKPFSQNTSLCAKALKRAKKKPSTGTARNVSVDITRLILTLYEVMEDQPETREFVIENFKEYLPHGEVLAHTMQVVPQEFPFMIKDYSERVLLSFIAAKIDALTLPPKEAYRYYTVFLAWGAAISEGLDEFAASEPYQFEPEKNDFVESELRSMKLHVRLKWYNCTMDVLVREDMTFDDLHSFLNDLFKRDDDHLYSFMLPDGCTPVRFRPDAYANQLFGSECYLGHHLEQGDKFRYVYDFGDCWYHKISVSLVRPLKKNETYPRLLKLTGTIPSQYGEHEDDWDEQEEDQDVIPAVSQDSIPLPPLKSPTTNSHLSYTWLFCEGFDTSAVQAPPDIGTPFALDETTCSIDLDTILDQPAKCEDDATLINRFLLPEDMTLAFGGACDWWLEAWLNGKPVFSTFPDGNPDALFTPDIYTYSVPAQKGENTLVIHVRRGQHSWQFAFAEKPLACLDATSPLTIAPHPEQLLGPVKPMNAVNNGPIVSHNTQVRTNIELWKAAKIPFARNHDASFCANYGGEYTVDVHAIFPNFDADPDAPASYNFINTDQYIQDTLEGGTQTYYRLGSKIEHTPVKRGTAVPPDFHKWAVICEHIIRHLNEGWADGHHFGIQHWEIWNEPELGRPAYSPTWQGTEQQFFDLFQITAKHLKACFPELKIGGPAAMYSPWMNRFLQVMRDNDVPIDFFSWHLYACLPKIVKVTIHKVRELLDSFGYTETESHLNEFNYLKGWGPYFMDSIKGIIGIKGAIYMASAMCIGQQAPLDMLMYYDARPCVFNGLFDFYTLAPLKTYFTFLAWAKLADLGTSYTIDLQDKNGVYAAAATDGNGNHAIIVARYLDSDDAVPPLAITLPLPHGRTETANMLLLDQTHDLEQVPFNAADGAISWDMAADSMVLITFSSEA